MAKNSFILYHDQKEVIDELTDEQAGKLFKAIYEYNVNKKYKLTGALKLVFIPFKTSFDRNEEKWDETAGKRSKAGKNHTGNQYTRKKELEQMEQVFQNGTNGTNGTVSVSVSGSVSDNVNVNVSDSVSVNVSVPTTHTEILDYCISDFKNYDSKDLEKSCKKFFNYYKEKEWKGVNNWQERIKMWIEDDIDTGKIKEKEKEQIDDAGYKHKNGRRLL